MKNKKNKPGYILILTLLMVSAATAIVTYIFNRGMVFVPFSQTVLARERAKMLAMGGIEVALAQLSYLPPKKDAAAQKQLNFQQGQAPKKTNPQEEAAKILLTRILPSLNRWQRFELTYPVDGIDALLEICIMSEEGKIDINEIFNFAQKKFRNEGQLVGDWKKLLQELSKKIEPNTGTQNLLTSLEKFLKKLAPKKLEDVTELLLLKEFEPFKNIIYYQPLNTDQKGKQPIYLTDIFTLHSHKNTLNPWLLSDSILALFDIKRAQENDIQNRIQQIANLLTKFTLQNEWKKDWSVLLKPLYEKDLNSLPKGIEAFFSTTFDPKIFSVRVHATVDMVTQYIFAIIERTSRSQNGEIVYAGKIKKIYWL